MSKELIERLLDNRVTGFNLTVAAVEAADLIEAQAAQIVMLRDALRFYKSALTADDVAGVALAATADLKGLRLCHAEPVRYLYQIHNCYGVPVWIDNYPRYGETVLETLPLYAPKGMK